MRVYKIYLVLYIFLLFSCTKTNQEVVWYKINSLNEIELSQSPVSSEKNSWVKIAIGPWEISDTIKYRSSEDFSIYKVEYSVLWKPADVRQYIKDDKNYNRYKKFLEPLIKGAVIESLLENEKALEKIDGNGSETITHELERLIIKKLKEQKMKTMDVTITEYFNVSVVSISVLIE